MRFTIHSETELDKAASALLEAFSTTRTFAFHGEMGVGKTTFIKALCRHLGVDEIMSSPTFSIVNEYAKKDGLPIFHFDFYRLNDESEAYAAGLHEYFDSGNFCFVEWPEKAASLLPVGTVNVYMKLDGQSRVVSADQ